MGGSGFRGLRLTVLRGIHTVAADFYDGPVIPSPEPAAPVRRRLPDWAFALALGVSVLALVYVPLWAPDPAHFVEPQAVGGDEPMLPERDAVGEYVALAEVRPDEEPPAVATVAVEAFGHDVSVDGRAFTWGASIRNTHGEYVADFGLKVSVEGVELYEDGELAAAYSGMTPPGGEVEVGGSFYLGDDFPSDPVVAIEVVQLEWFAFEGGTPPDPTSPQSARLAEIHEDADSYERMRFSVTITNTAAYAIRPGLTAVFRRADGTPVGGAGLFLIEPVPPGDSTREVTVWEHDVPAGADLAMTAFVTTW